MPLEVLAPLVLAGLAIIIGAVHLSGGSQKGGPMSIELATTRFGADFPDFSPESVVIDDFNSVALLTSTKSNEVGLLMRMGQHYLTRLLQPGSSSIKEIHPNQIEIQLTDPSLPKMVFTLSDTKVQIDLMERLIMLKRSR